MVYKANIQKLTSIAVSSLTEDAMAPALVAPMALDKARAVANPLPVPSCSTDTKQGNPLPFSYNERTEEPIILQAHISAQYSSYLRKDSDTWVQP